MVVLLENQSLETERTRLFNEDMELIKTRITLNKLLRLNISLYSAILNYAQRKGIPLTLDSEILQLVEEIEKTDEVNLAKNIDQNRRNVTDSWKNGQQTKREQNLKSCDR
jgi:hypothetical protein